MPRTNKASAPSIWPIIITEWGLDSYLNLKHAGTFTPAEYKKTIRPDVLLLRQGIPSPHSKFQSSSFWGPAKQGNVVLAGGYKMKWRHIGPGQVQLRLPVAARAQSTYLCHCYVKSNAAYEARQLARFKTHMNLISLGRFTHRGTL